MTLRALQSGEMYENVLNCIQNYLGLIYYSRRGEDDGVENREYSFVHHQFRDYFSAIWNRILLEAMPMLVKDSALIAAYLDNCVWQGQKIHMLSELHMEHRNRPYYDEVDKVWKNQKKRYTEQNITINALNCLRNTEQNHKNLISNLLRVVLEGRRELSGLDLGELDLTGFSLYGVPCSKGLNKTIRLSAGFYGAQINEQTLVPLDHRDRVIDIVYHSDKCYTLDSDGIIKCWEIRSGVLLDEWQSETPNLFGFSPFGYLKVSPNGRFLASQIQLPDTAGIKLIDMKGENKQGLVLKPDRDLRLETMAFSRDSKSLLMLDKSGTVYSYDCTEQILDWKIEIRNLYYVTQICTEGAGGKVWLFSAQYSLENLNTDVLWRDEEEMYEDVENEGGILCKILTLDPDTGNTEVQREFMGSPGTSPAACCISERGAVLYYDGYRGSLMIGVGKQEGWEVFREITAQHPDETMTIFRDRKNLELFYIIYPDEIYLVSINRRFYCSIVSRYQAKAVNALAESTGQENDLVFCSTVVPSRRYFVLMNDDGVYYEWDEKENIIQRKYNFFYNECVGLFEDKIGEQYILLHRNNSICFFDSNTDQLIGSQDLYEQDYEVRLCHFVEKDRILAITMVRLDNEKVIALNVDTGYSTLLFSTSYKNETVETIDSNVMSGKLLLTTQYRCCEIDLYSLEEREVAHTTDNRRFISGQYDKDVLKIVDVADTSDTEIENPICSVYVEDSNVYRLQEKITIKELPPELYPYFIYHNDDFGTEGSKDPNGIQRFWITGGFFLQLEEKYDELQCEMPLKPYEEGFVWHRHELRHYGEYQDRDIRIMSQDERGILFVRNSRTLYFARDIHGLTYEELDNALKEEKGYLGGDSYWSFVIRMENGDLICNYEGDGLMRLDGNTGEIIREISYTPGLVLWGCNFQGVEASDEVKKMLKENGAIVNR